jgi:hypothetical protein
MLQSISSPRAEGASPPSPPQLHSKMHLHVVPCSYRHNPGLFSSGRDLKCWADFDEFAAFGGVCRISRSCGQGVRSSWVSILRCWVSSGSSRNGFMCPKKCARKSCNSNRCVYPVDSAIEGTPNPTLLQGPTGRQRVHSEDCSTIGWACNSSSTVRFVTNTSIPALGDLVSGVLTAVQASSPTSKSCRNPTR